MSIATRGRAAACWIGLVAGLSGLMASLTPSSAQDQTAFVQAFSGPWSALDARFGTGDGVCQIELMTTPSEMHYALRSENCGGELAKASFWGVVEMQLALLDGNRTVLARLGGSQQKVTGSLVSGAPLILDRNTSGWAQFQPALKASGCFYLGFTSQCAGFQDMSAPISTPTPSGQRVRILADVNVRGEPRDDAPISGVVQRNTCVAVDDCLTAADGIWCRARFGEAVGWLRKHGLRQGKWPVVTFANRCS